MFGWMGQRLRLDLTNKSYEIEKLPVKYYKKWLGGRGFNSDVVYQETSWGMDPYDPQNPLCFAAGALAGTFSPLSGNTVVSACSPMTGSIMGTNFHGGCDTNIGDAFGAMMKYTGYDQIIVKGKAGKPMYVFIDDDRIEFRDASHLWGLGTRKAFIKILEENIDPDIKVVLIGPAGENLVRFACVKDTFSVANGRMGMGAVMGSKNLKAIAVKGTKPVRIAYPAEFMNLSWALCDNIYRLISDKRNEVDWPINYTKDVGKVQQWIKGAKQFRFKRVSCWGCPVTCKSFIYIKEGKYAGFFCSSSEIEKFCKFEPGIKTGDLSDMIILCSKANDLGMDTISAGAALSMTIEAFEKGHLTREDIGNVTPDRKDIKSLMKVLDMTAHRIGFGNLLAEGKIDRAGKSGINPTHRIRLEKNKNKCIVEAVGGCCQAVNFLEDSGIWEDVYSAVFKHATGINFSDEEIFRAAERIINTERAQWLRESSGFKRGREEDLQVRMTKQEKEEMQ